MSIAIDLPGAGPWQTPLSVTLVPNGDAHQVIARNRFGVVVATARYRNGRLSALRPSLKVKLHPLALPRIAAGLRGERMTIRKTVRKASRIVRVTMPVATVQLNAQGTR